MRAQHLVPHVEKRLRKVELGAVQLMVYIMVSRVVLEQPVKGIPRQAQPAVVVYRFDRREREEEDGRARGHPGQQKRNRAPDCVHEKAFDRVVV